MRRLLQFLVALVLGLGLVAWIASRIVDQQTREWFDKDLNLRAALAISGARQALIGHWHKEDRADLQGLLTEITHDERIMAAAACASDLTLLTKTADFPEQFTCRAIGTQIRPAAPSPSAAWLSWSTIQSLPVGDVYVNAIPVMDRDQTLGFVVLVHDLSFVARREAKTQNFLLIAFGFLALAASAVTIIASRLSWRSWSDEVRRFLRGGTRAQRPEFKPILGDVRDLVDRIVAEREADHDAGAWTPQRLRSTLSRFLHGEKIVILANREPYIHERQKSGGGIAVLHPASGLVTALEPVMRACSGTWIAHGGGSGDKETADRHGGYAFPREKNRTFCDA